jgi:hypothetical protein
MIQRYETALIGTGDKYATVKIPKKLDSINAEIGEMKHQWQQQPK